MIEIVEEITIWFLCIQIFDILILKPKNKCRKKYETGIIQREIFYEVLKI